QAESEGASDGAKLLYKRKFSAGIPAYGLERTFGYTADEDGVIRIVEQEAQTVRLIFDLAAKGIWPSKIGTYLNENGITTGSGCKWDATAVFRVLHNPAFKGDMVLQKTYLDDRRVRHKNEGQADQWYITDNHPAIVAPEQWDAVQDILRKRSEHLKREQCSPTSPRDCKATYPLSGKLFCPRCGCKLIHKWGKGEAEYWVCRTNLKVGASACKGVWLPANVANSWGEISEPTTVFEYEDEYGMKHYTGYPKEEYESSPDCPYSISQERVG
ncbi:MAG: recombinase family protein, partial [Firmicutes bacterium]|nr:recombinase family protein [Bacillota bacterium]